MAILRVWVFTLCALEAIPPLHLLANLPDASFRAFGFFLLLPDPIVHGLLSPVGLGLVRWVALIAALAAALGLVTRFAMVLATIGLILFQGVTRGFTGFVNHAQLPLILFALVLCFAPADQALTLWPRRRRQIAPSAWQFTLVTLMALLCFGYLFIGAHRLAYGGIELFSSASLQQWIVYWNLDAPDLSTRIGMQVVNQPVLSRLASVSFPLITMLEVSAPLCLLSGAYRKFFAPTMLSVHLGIYLIMRINFLELALLYLVFIDSRYWSPAAARPGGDAIVFFDGFCGLCNRFVDFLLARDRDHRLWFAPLQGITASQRLGRLESSDPDSIVYLEGDHIEDRSTAVLSAVGRLGGGWSFVALLGLLPGPLRDAMYRVLARNRYRWFGRTETCRLPTEAERVAFLP